jgi:DNA-binding LytR/AlgR family response regulator
VNGLRILAVDDEQAQLDDLARLLRRSPLVEEVECAGEGREALGRLAENPYHAVFLDVRMPDLDGLELARVLRRFAAPPQLVFVSAYDSSAVDAFELKALDYLRKPVASRRLAEALERVAAVVEGPSGAGEPAPDGEVVAVSSARSGTTRLLARRQVNYVQAQGDFVRLCTADGRFLLRNTLAEVERRWAPHGFVRVHRQYLVNLAAATEIRPLLGGGAELVLGDGSVVPIARRHLAELRQRLRV